MGWKKVKVSILPNGEQSDKALNFTLGKPSGLRPPVKSVLSADVLQPLTHIG
jgi:hypothetical protein